jgi:hypothetical protein
MVAYESFSSLQQRGLLLRNWSTSMSNEHNLEIIEVGRFSILSDRFMREIFYRPEQVVFRMLCYAFLRSRPHTARLSTRA